MTEGIPPGTAASAREPRVLWLTEEFYPPQIGGVELMVSRLCEALAQAGSAVHVITRQPDPPCEPDVRIGGCRVTRLPPGGQLKGAGWRAAPRLAAFLGRLAAALIRDAGSYDVIIVSGMKVIPLVAVPLGRLLRKPCIVRVESTIEVLEPVSAESSPPRGLRGRLTRWCFARLQRTMLANADRVVALSTSLERMLVGLGVRPSRISRIGNAVDLRKFRPVSPAERRALREALGLPQQATLMLFAGRLSRAKGIDLLVRVWPQVMARYPDLHLLIAGSGRDSFDDCEGQLHESLRASPRLAERVHLLGATDRVHLYLQASDLYVLPSEYEGFSLGVIEALAAGLPALLTPVGGVPELIRDGENGFVFAARDGRALLAAVDAAMAARDRWPEIGQRARATVAAMDLDAVASDYRSLIDTLLAPFASRPGPGQTVR